MDAFSLIVLLALGACVLLHLFGHGHGHSRGSSGHGDHAAQTGKPEDIGESARAAQSASRREAAAGSRHRHGRGCH